MQTSTAIKKSYVVTVSLSQEEANLLLNVYREILNRLCLSPEELQVVRALVSSVPKPADGL